MGDQWGSWDDSEDDQRDDLGDESPTYLDALEDEEPDDRPESPLFTVANPHEMVAVTASIDGGIRQVGLAPAVVKMTEYELADEIRAMARLATMKAGSVVHAFLVEGLRMTGHDPALTSSTLSRGLGLRSPEQVAEVTRKVFEERYGHDGE